MFKPINETQREAHYMQHTWQALVQENVFEISTSSHHISYGRHVALLFCPSFLTCYPKTARRLQRMWSKAHVVQVQTCGRCSLGIVTVHYFKGPREDATRKSGCLRHTIQLLLLGRAGRHLQENEGQ
jgi:hypothetical protein